MSGYYVKADLYSRKETYCETLEEVVEALIDADADYHAGAIETVEQELRHLYGIVTRLVSKLDNLDDMLYVLDKSADMVSESE